MSIDKRCKHDRMLRERACALFKQGYGYKHTARLLGIAQGTVRKWQLTYLSVGKDSLLNMGKTHRKYAFETKLAAVQAVLDAGMTKPEAMEHFGIISVAPLNVWCRLYREGGAEALRPKPKGRPKGSHGKARPKSREEELELEIERLEAQVAYLKKSIALKAMLRSQTEGKH